MKKRLLAGAGATALAASLLAIPSARADNSVSTATLRSSDRVVPSATDDIAGDTSPFELRVTNGGQPSGLGGVVGSLLALDAIRVSMPPSLTDVDCGSIEDDTDFDCSVFEIPGFGLRQLRLSGGSVASQSSVDLRFGATVEAPPTSDARAGAFVVQTSNDGGQTFQRSAEDTEFDIVGLELSPVEDLRSTSTAGRTVRVGYAVHSSEDSAFEPSVLIEDAPDGVRARLVAPRFDPTPGASGTFAFVIDGPAPTDEDYVLDIEVVDGGDGEFAASTGTFTVTVERPAELDFDADSLELNGASRDEVSAFATGLSLAIDAEKTNEPGADGPIDVVAELSGPGVSIPLDLVSGAIPRGEDPEVPFSFEARQFDISDVVGTVALDLEIAITGTDDNGAPITLEQTLEDIITIDAEAPAVTIAEFNSGNADASRVKDGDTVTVTGTVDTGGADDVVAEDLDVTITNGAGFSASTADGSATISLEGDEFTATAPVDQLGASGDLTASVSAVDDAGNGSLTVSASLGIDNIAPAFTPSAAPLAYYDDEGAPTLTLTLRDGAPYSDGVVTGGCGATSWAVDGATVLSVSGGACDDAEGNDRVLTLDRELAEFRSVTYDPSRLLGIGDPIADGAGNVAAATYVVVVDGSLPRVPLLFAAGRTDSETGDRERAATPHGCRVTTDGCEDAWLNVHTNTDAVIQVRDGRVGDRIEIVEVSLAATGATLGDVVSSVAYTEADIAVPIDTCAGSCEVLDQAFAVRIVRPVQGRADRVGPAQPFLVSYDHEAPTVSSARRGDDGTSVEITFTELLRDLVATDAAGDYTIIEQTPFGPYASAPNRVRRSPTADVRILEMDRSEGDLLGVQFSLDSGHLEDFAGNIAVDGYAPVAG